jgi:hypothetical protein
MKEVPMKRVGLTILAVLVVAGVGFLAVTQGSKRRSGATYAAGIADIGLDQGYAVRPVGPPHSRLPKSLSAATAQPVVASNAPNVLSAVTTNSPMRDFEAEIERALAAGDLSLLRDLLREWGGRDLEAAVGWVEKTVAAAHHKGDPLFQTLAEWSCSLPAGNSRSRAMRAVGLGWVQVAPSQAMDWITTHMQKAGTDSWVLMAMATQWGKGDPTALRQWGAQLSESSNRDAAWSIVVDTLGKTDLPGLREFIAELPDGDIKTYAWGRYFHFGVDEWAKANPATTLQWIQESLNGHARTEFIAKATRIWAAQAPAAALRWVQQLPEGNDRDSAFPEVAALWATENPAEAARLAKENLVAIEAVARAWAAADPEAASRWAAQLQSRARGNAIGAVATAWAAKDGEAALRWACQLPDDGGRALLHVAVGWARSEPDKAMAFAAKGLPDGVRSLGLIQVYGIWWRTDPQAAKAWVEQSSLALDMKAELAKDPTTRPPVVGL